jgi:hypothetical protein
VEGIRTTVKDGGPKNEKMASFYVILVFRGIEIEVFCVPLQRSSEQMT